MLIGMETEQQQMLFAINKWINSQHVTRPTKKTKQKTKSKTKTWPTQKSPQKSWISAMEI